MDIDASRFKNLTITGPISFQRVTGMTASLTTNIVIFGPTGAGKSSFIEALIGDTTLGLSKDQLEGFTQEVAAYQLINVKSRNHSPICIVDTPGFADRKISEMEIITKFQEFMAVAQLRIDYIIFLSPITDVRLSGSRKRVINTFTALTGVSTSRQIALVTTMWNQLHTETAQKQAELRFKELSQRSLWNKFFDKDYNYQKFFNTQESALNIINVLFEIEAPYMFTIGQEKQISGDSPYYPNLVSDLDERIQQLCYQERNLLDDIELYGSENNVDPELLKFLEAKVSEIGDDLERFGRERVQLEGALKRSEIKSIVGRLSSEFHSYVFQLERQYKDHDWDTNKPFQPLPLPPSFQSLIQIQNPTVLLGASSSSSSIEDHKHPLQISPTVAMKEKDDRTLLLVGSMEERMRGMQKEMEELKQHISQRVSRVQVSSTQGTGAAQRKEGAPRIRNWLDSVKSWKEARSKK